jgi:hypothetical protein
MRSLAACVSISAEQYVVALSVSVLVAAVEPVGDQLTDHRTLVLLKSVSRVANHVVDAPSDP